VTGVDGHMYNVIRDESIFLNALFVTAYTTGLHIDPATQEVQKFRPKGTWMGAVGLTLVDTASMEKYSLTVSTEESESFADICALKPQECIVGGSISIDGAETVLTGVYKMGSVGTVSLKNHKSFGRVSIVSEAFKADIDFVPPPAEWDVRAEETAEYSHLNLKLKEVVLSEAANGVLGCSVRVKKTAAGEPIMVAFDKDGAGILDAPVSAYEVGDIADSSFPMYSEEWAASVQA